MGGCYSKKASQLGDPYIYHPTRQDSPIRVRKKTMNRTAPYPRATAPAHGFGFRRRAVPAVTSQRVRPTDSAPAGKRTNHGSRESVASNSSGDSNGNTQRSLTIPARRQLPRPQIAHVKPRTAATGSGSSRQTARANASKVNDSGLGTTRGSMTSIASSDKGEDSTLMPGELAPIASGEDFNEVGEGLESSGSDFQVGIQTEGATIALSVNIHKGVNPATRPQVTVSDPAVKTKVTQIQRPGFGYTQPAGLTRPPGLSQLTQTQVTSAPLALTSKTTRVATSITRPAKPTSGGVPAATARAANGASVNGSPQASKMKRSITLPTAKPGLTSLDQTVRSRVTKWEEKVTQLSQEAEMQHTRAASEERHVGKSFTKAGSPNGAFSKPVFKPSSSVRFASPVTPGAHLSMIPHAAYPSPVALSTPVSACFQRSPRGSFSKRAAKPAEQPSNSIVQLRKEMKQLTRDVATSPLHRPRVRDTGTCTETSPPRMLHGSPSGDSEFSPGLSGMQTSRSGIEDYIDDEIGDQPAFGTAFGRHDMGSSVHSDGFIDDVIEGMSLSLVEDPLPPLEITEAARPCDVSDYVRPFRLTPRPVAALTTLETPLRRQAADLGSSASARRQQMEDRAEKQARRLQLKIPPPGAAILESDSDSGLGSTYQRLGLCDPNAATNEESDAQKTDEDLTESHDVLSSAEPSLSRDESLEISAANPDLKSRKLVGEDAAKRSSQPEQDRGMVLSEYSRNAVEESRDFFSEIPRGQVLRISRDQEKSISRVLIRQDSTESEDSPAAGTAALDADLTAAGTAALEAETAQEVREASAEAESEVVEAVNEGFQISGGCRPREPAAVYRHSSEAPPFPPDAATAIYRRDAELQSLPASDSGAGGAACRRLSELREDLASPTVSLGSDDLMADFDKDSDTLCEDDESLSGQVSRLQRVRIRSSDGGRPSPDSTSSGSHQKLFKPPRQSSQSSDVGDWLLIDRDTYMYMAQDFTHTKTMLHKLRRILQDTETASPFENSFHAAKSRAASLSSDSQLSSIDTTVGCELAVENAQLKRQLASLQAQLEEKDRTILLLQQQMAKYSSPPSAAVASIGTQASQPPTDDPHVITVCAGN